LLVESKLAVDHDLEPCTWDSEDAYFRGIIDVAVVKGDKAYAFDWKTGRQKDDHDQLNLFSALLFAHYPALEQVASAYVWLQNSAVTSAVMFRSEVSDVWAHLATRVHQLVKALEHDNWPARPSGLCKRWCPVGYKRCEYCGQ